MKPFGLRKPHHVTFSKIENDYKGLNSMKNSTTDYKNWLTELKGKIRSVQIKAAISVNSSLIQFYWELGKMISEKQTAWGSKFLATLSNDLQDEFPEMKGFSITNLKYCKLF